MTTGRYRITTAMLLLHLFAASPGSSAQVFSNYSPNEAFFHYEVKVIDEFIERFNDDHSSYLRKAYTKAKKPYNITRTKLLVSLFNLENTSFTDKDTTLMGFFRQVVDTMHPVYIAFTDSDWYAEARSIFLYNGKLVEIPLALHVKSEGNEWSKWMITGIGNRAPSKEPMPSVSANKLNGKPAQYISTSAYATNFVELHYIFSANMAPEYYFEPQLLANEKGKQFVEMIKSGQLKFQYVKNITFHFYQVSGWIFTVDQFNRKTLNNGWLISSMQKTTRAEKDAARKKLLNR
ncbi:MAG: hypothetical protein ACHQD8_04920 [Chitinophagales bacterium]